MVAILTITAALAALFEGGVVAGGSALVSGTGVGVGVDSSVDVSAGVASNTGCVTFSSGTCSSWAGSD